MLSIYSLFTCLLIGNILILTNLSTVQARHSLQPSLFSIRGGGFFGFRNKQSTSSGDDSGGDEPPKKYPPLTQSEIETLLNVPIFGITDLNGNGVILSDGGQHIFHFFLNRHMAEAACGAVANANVGAPELKVSAFHLGKCWFKLIVGSGERSFKLTKCGDGSGPETKKPIHFRLVPNMKDLMGAKILTGLKPGDVTNLKAAIEAPDAQKAISIIHQASNSATSFTKPFDQVPVFAISQMRVRKKDSEGNPEGEALLPMHLSTKTMTDTWKEFILHSPQFEDAEATLQLVELHSLVDMMQARSDFDFRKVVFITPSYENDEVDNDNSEDSNSDDDDGGGGDNGMMSQREYCEDVSVESFVSYSECTLSGVPS